MERGCSRGVPSRYGGAAGSRGGGWCCIPPSLWGFDRTPPWQVLKRGAGTSFLPPRSRAHNNRAGPKPAWCSDPSPARCGGLWAGEKIAVAPLSGERSICQAGVVLRVCVLSKECGRMPDPLAMSAVRARSERGGGWGGCSRAELTRAAAGGEEGAAGERGLR